MHQSKQQQLEMFFFKKLDKYAYIGYTILLTTGIAIASSWVPSLQISEADILCTRLDGDKKNTAWKEKTLARSDGRTDRQTDQSSVSQKA